MGSFTADAGKRAEEGWNAFFLAHFGPDGATLAWTGIFVLGVVLGVIFARYVLLLRSGGAAEGSLERADYDALRARLAEGGGPAQVYTRRLTVFLKGADRFFGDSDKAHLSAFPRAFGLHLPAPLWTGAAYDRCLLLALLYPTVSILMIWVIAGDVGLAERTLGLAADVSEWLRDILVGGVALGAFSFWRFYRSSHWTRFLWLAVAVPVSLALPFVFGGAVALAVDFAFAFTGAFAFSGAVAVAVTAAVAVASAGAVAFDFAAAAAAAAAATAAFTMAVYAGKVGE